MQTEEIMRSWLVLPVVEVAIPGMVVPVLRPALLFTTTLTLTYGLFPLPLFFLKM